MFGQSMDGRVQLLVGILNEARFFSGWAHALVESSQVDGLGPGPGPPLTPPSNLPSSCDVELDSSCSRKTKRAAGEGLCVSTGRYRTRTVPLGSVQGVTLVAYIDNVDGERRGEAG